MAIWYEVGKMMREIRGIRNDITPSDLAVYMETTVKKVKLCERGEIIFNEHGLFTWCCIMAIEGKPQPGSQVILTDEESAIAKKLSGFIHEAMKKDIQRRKDRGKSR